MTLYAVIGILQLFNIDILHLYAKNRYFLNSHFVTTSGNIDFVSGTLCIMLPILCGAVVLLRDRWRWFLLIPVALCMLLAIQINVDAFYVGIFGAFLISIPFWVREKAC